VLGGADGSLATITKIDADGSETRKPVIGDVELVPGEWVRGFECGGGGYGNPLDRDPDAVRRDVLDRWVSPEAAREDYGVVLIGSQADLELEVDLAATEQLRRRLRYAPPGPRPDAALDFSSTTPERGGLG
jgi:N-methylhydantoinase B